MNGPNLPASTSLSQDSQEYLVFYNDFLEDFLEIADLYISPDSSCMLLLQKVWAYKQGNLDLEEFGSAASITFRLCLSLQETLLNDGVRFGPIENGYYLAVAESLKSVPQNPIISDFLNCVEQLV